MTIDDMIKCAEREVGMRERVYPRWVEAKKMSQAKADSEMATMKAIVEFLKKHKEQDNGTGIVAV